METVDPGMRKDPSEGARWQRTGALLAVLALSAFVACVVWLQFARTDLDWVRATLSLYLQGPYGLLLRIAYCLLALAIIVLGVGLHAQMQAGPGRRGLPVALFGMAGIGLAGVAIGDSWLPGYAPLLAPLVHGLSAQTAFLCASVAMLVQAWCFGRDPGWRPRYRLAWYWAWGAFAALWLHVLWRGSPRGLGQKAVIALVVGWLLWVAWAVWRRPHKGSAETDGSGHNGAHLQRKDSCP